MAKYILRSQFPTNHHNIMNREQDGDDQKETSAVTPVGGTSEVVGITRSSSD
jgi:hypothetical protein